MCLVQSGVLQGCPLAAMLFVLGIEPFLCKMYDVVIHQSLGIVMACADNIAVVLQSIATPPALAEIFLAAERLAGLTLKPVKCFIVPLFAPCTPDTTMYIRDYLVQYRLAWKDFSITATAEYLGVWLGPAAATRNWSAQLGKFCNRINIIASSAPPTCIAVGTYNIKAVTTLSYPAQFLPSPQD